MKGTISFRDCEAKQPWEKFPLMNVNAQPSGLDVVFLRGIDELTRRACRYKTSLTPAIGLGEWENPHNTGDMEKVVQAKEGYVTVVTGIWVESGERLEFKIELEGA